MQRPSNTATVIKAWRLPVREKLLGMQALLLLTTVRALLYSWRLTRIRRMLDRPHRAETPSTEALSASRIIWAVEAVRRFCPLPSTCLAEALTAQFLLQRHGYPATLHIGAAIGPKGEFQAHAWLENEGAVLIGGPASFVSQYTPFPDIDQRTA